MAVQPSAFSFQPSDGALEGTRTPGLQVRNLSLYPLSYERPNPPHCSAAVYYTKTGLRIVNERLASRIRPIC